MHYLRDTHAATHRVRLAASGSVASRSNGGGGPGRGGSVRNRFLWAAQPVRFVDCDRILRTLLEANPGGPRLAPLLQRPLATNRRRLVLGQRRAIGLGPLP